MRAKWLTGATISQSPSAIFTAVCERQDVKYKHRRRRTQDRISRLHVYKIVFMGLGKVGLQARPPPDNSAAVVEALPRRGAIGEEQDHDRPTARSGHVYGMTRRRRQLSVTQFSGQGKPWCAEPIRCPIIRAVSRARRGRGENWAALKLRQQAMETRSTRSLSKLAVDLVRLTATAKSEALTNPQSRFHFASTCC